MLLQRDEDAKSEVTTNKEKEIISTIASIFLSIKHSEDIVDTSKSKVEITLFFPWHVKNCKIQSNNRLILHLLSMNVQNSHAICDLGLAITKRLVQKDIDLQGLSHLVSLPPMLYKTSEKEGDDTLVCSFFWPNFVVPSSMLSNLVHSMQSAFQLRLFHSSGVACIILTYYTNFKFIKPIVVDLIFDSIYGI